MHKRVLVLSSLVLVLSLVLAGCGQRITAEQIVAKMRETAQSTVDAHAVVKVDVNAMGIDLSATAEMWEKSPNSVYAEVIDASRPEFKGMTLVTDGQQAWFYDPARNQVEVGAAGKMELPLPQEMLTSMQGVIQQVLDASNVQLAGEESVAGHDAYKLTFSPKEGSNQQLFPGNGIATVWVDQERWITLKATYEASSLGQGTIEILSYELNPGVPDTRFHLEIPEGAEVVDVHAEQPLPLTLDEARTQAAAEGYSLLVPGYVPAGATLIEVFKTGGTIILRYDHSPQVSFTVMQGYELPEGYELSHLSLLGEPKETTVRGQQATVIAEEASGNTFVYWTENGAAIAVAGSISLEEAIKVAESLQ
jgi:outer membrane lipoprotein-sorting protein